MSKKKVRLSGKTINPKMRGKTGRLVKVDQSAYRPYSIKLDDPDFSDPPVVTVRSEEFEVVE